MRVFRIIPAILSYTLEDLDQKLSQVEEIASRVQIDIVGEAFSPQTSVRLSQLEDVVAMGSMDIQLMVQEPIGYLGRCDLVGVDRVFGHVEQMESQQAFIEHAFALGMEVGLALDLPTPVAAVEETLSQVDAVLLMAVPAGKSGQRFDRRVLQKIRDIHTLQPEIPICVDGGMTPQTIGPCAEEGAVEFAVGSFLWESRDVGKAMHKLEEALS